MREARSPSTAEAGAEEQPAATAPSRRDRYGGLPAQMSRAFCLVVANVAMIALVRLLAVHRAFEISWGQQVMICVAMLLASTYVAMHQWYHWAAPTHQLLELVERVRDGRAGSRDLQNVHGSMKPLAQQMGELLDELSSRRAQIVRLEAQMNQRLAQRTDALERALGTLRVKASRDALTGLYNRRMLDEHLPQLLAKCEQENVPLCLLMLDVDRFKMLNDTLGHAAGDEFLRQVGQLIRSTLRSEDMAFRYGGDEFCLLLPGATEDIGKKVGDRLMSLVDGLARTLRVPMPPGLSAGVSSIGGSADMDAAQLIAQADKVLYRIKAARRNRRTA